MTWHPNIFSLCHRIWLIKREEYSKVTPEIHLTSRFLSTTMCVRREQARSFAKVAKQLLSKNMKITLSFNINFEYLHFSSSLVELLFGWCLQFAVGRSCWLVNLLNWKQTLIDEMPLKLSRMWVRDLCTKSRQICIVN